MLSPYVFCSSPIQELHNYAEQFIAICCAAKAGDTFDISLFEDDKLRVFLQTGHNKYLPDRLPKKVENNQHFCLSNKKTLLETIESLFNTFRDKLSDDEKKGILSGFAANNEIEALCNNKSGTTFVHEKDLPVIVRGEIMSLFADFYTVVLNRTAFYKSRETLKAHFDRFSKLNKNLRVCRFCGLAEMKNEFYQHPTDPTRSKGAYDHFLAKGKYPFVGINLWNLVPICHDCNSGYKLQRDVLHSSGRTRSRVFYPYAQSVPPIKVEINFHNPTLLNVNALKPSDFEVNLVCSDVEAVETWNDIFEIKRRYSANISGNIDTWIDELKDRYKKSSSQYNSPTDFIDFELEILQYKPLPGKKFLKHAIFKALHEQNLLVPALS